MSKPGVKIFISYSHKDSVYCESFKEHLAPLARQGLVSTWHDREIVPGEKWEDKIDENLSNSDIFVALISPSFIASDYCFGKELGDALTQHENGKTTVLPVLIRPCRWNNLPISKLHSLPSEMEAVSSWQNEDEAWLNVIEGIELAASKQIQSHNERPGEGQGLTEITEILRREVDRLDYRSSSSGDLGEEGVTTGIPLLDEMIDGFHNGQLAVIASRPLNGCEKVARSITAHVSFHLRRRVAYYSMQIPAEHLARELISTESQIQSGMMLRAWLSEDDWLNYTNAIGLLKDAPLFIDESANFTFSELLDSIRANHAKTKFNFVVIDKLSNIIHGTSEQISESRRAHELKALARELNVPILAIAGVSSQIEARPNKRPLLIDLTYWPEFDDAADIILFTYDNGYYNYDVPHELEIIVARNLNGPIGTIELVDKKRPITQTDQGIDKE